MTKSKETATMATERIEAADQQAQKLNSAAQAMPRRDRRTDRQYHRTDQFAGVERNHRVGPRRRSGAEDFAVVASEVKNLANQAKHAADTITKEIEALNGVASDVVGSLTAIKAAIASVNEFIASTAAAVEEQSIVTVGHVVQYATRLGRIGLRCDSPARIGSLSFGRGSEG